MTGWVLGVLGSLVAAFIFETIYKRRGKEKDSDNTPKFENEVKKEFSFAPDESMNHHRQALRLGCQKIFPNQASLKINEKLKVVKHLDGSDKGCLPSILSWNPDGDLIAVASHAFGLDIWSTYGTKFTKEPLEGSLYGYPHYIFWSNDGLFATLFSCSNRFFYLVNYSSHGYRLAINEKLNYEFGFDYMLNHINKDQAINFSPWRPGKNDLLFSHFNGPEFYSCNYKTLQSDKALKKILISPIYDFSDLGAKDVRVFRFCWDNSGRYLAITIGSSSSNRKGTRVHILEFDTGVIVTTISKVNIGLFWTPDSNELVCEKFVENDLSSPNREYFIWSYENMGLRLPTDEDLEKPWIKSAKYFSDLPLGKPNADGTRIFFEGKILDIDDPTRVLAELPKVQFASWSPKDPNLLATVGGSDAPESLRLWSV